MSLLDFEQFMLAELSLNSLDDTVHFTFLSDRLSAQMLLVLQLIFSQGLRFLEKCTVSQTEWYD